MESRAQLFGHPIHQMLILTGWLGGELVERLAIGVAAGANVNAPSSLRTSGARR
jgi:hypothetical protein